MRLRAAMVIGCAGAAAAAPAFVGARACAECHRPQYERQIVSSHAWALRPIGGSALAAQLLRQGALRDLSYRYEYAREGEAIAVTAAGAEDSSRMRLLWAFGSGAQAFTPVGRAGERWIEHRISFYTTPSRLSLTPGHAGRANLTAADALGIVQESGEMRRCFGCHATNVRGDGDAWALESGVQCERCHGPGSEHLAAARAADAARLAKTVLNAGRFPAAASVMICGECHRTPNPARLSTAPELEDPLSVRFQPVGLMASRCFQASGKLSCLSCHDAHGDARKDDGWYTAKCLSCHEGRAPAQSACRRAAREICLPCHMRRVTPAPHLSFVDHRIRVDGR